MSLENYRKEIDEIDSQLITLLQKRFEVVKKVGIYKKEHNLKPLQPARWQEVLDSKKLMAKNIWLDEKFVEDVWNRIHENSLNLEK